MGTDTDNTVALARMIRSRARRIERDLLELRGLATQLLETVDTSDTEKGDTDNGSRNGNGAGSAGNGGGQRQAEADVAGRAQTVA